GCRPDMAFQGLRQEAAFRIERTIVIFGGRRYLLVVKRDPVREAVGEFLRKPQVGIVDHCMPKHAYLLDSPDPRTAIVGHHPQARNGGLVLVKGFALPFLHGTSIYSLSPCIP